MSVSRSHDDVMNIWTNREFHGILNYDTVSLLLNLGLNLPDHVIITSQKYLFSISVHLGKQRIPRNIKPRFCFSP